MPEITQDYIEALPAIYKDIFRALWMFNPRRKEEFDIPIQSLYSVLSDKYNWPQIQVACDSMVRSNVLINTNEDFYRPTELGEQILEAVTAGQPVEVEPFPLPPEE